MTISQSHKSAVRTISYDLHHIIRIRSDIDLGLEYFKCAEQLEEIDLIIKVIGHRPIDKAKYQQVASGLYYSRDEDRIISNMSIFGIKISWELRNILSDVTELRVSRSYVFLSRYILFSPISSVHNLIGLTLRILQLKMLLKKHSFLIGGSAFLNNKTVIFSGTGGSGKTLTTVNFVDNYDAEFMSDDFLILSNNSFYSFPTPLRFRRFNLDFVSYSNFVDPVDRFQNRIRDKANGGSEIYFLELSESRSIKEITLEETIEKLCNLNNRALLHNDERILSFLPYMHSELSLLELQQRQIDILAQRLEKARCFIISAPSTLDYNKMLDSICERQ